MNPENKYDKDLFLYVTDSENYIAAKDLAEIIPAIDEQLINDFWGEVSKHYVESGWSFKLENQDFTLEKSTTWQYFVICKERLDIGIRKKANEIDSWQNQENVKSLVTAWGYPKNNDVWPCWKPFPNLDFTQKRNLFRILPSKRHIFLSELLIEMEKLEEYCEEINQKFK